jgi:hypothetical protein
MKMPKILCLILLVVIVHLEPGSVSASRKIPGNLTPEQTPQFVCIGFDDNYYADGMIWILNYLKNLKNPVGKNNFSTYDGTPVRVSFFNNTNNSEHVVPGTALADTYVDAYKDGHEIGDHTRKHNTSASTSYNVWKSEIAGCKNELAMLKIPPNKIIGFRSPFLLYNDETFTVLKETGFIYDCSIETGFDEQSEGTDFTWPYKLDNGTPDNIKIKRHPGLWEMPVYAVIVPLELRAQIKEKAVKFNNKTGKARGLDWDLVSGFEEGGYGFSKAEYLNTLKNSLDQRLKGNRAPMLFGAHTPFYTAEATGVDIHPPNITYQEMREVIQEFIMYALSKPEVRIVPFFKILEWCKKPVALNTTAENKHRLIKNPATAQKESVFKPITLRL